MKRAIAAAAVVGMLAVGGVAATPGIGHAPKWRVVRCHTVYVPTKHVVCTIGYAY